MSMSVEAQRERAREWAAQNLGVRRTNLTGVLTSIPRQNIAHEREMEREREYERNINREMDLRQNQEEQTTDETVPGHYNQMHDIVMRIQNANNNQSNQGNQGNQGGRNIKKSRKSKKCKRKGSRRRFRKNHSKKYK